MHRTTYAENKNRMAVASASDQTHHHGAKRKLRYQKCVDGPLHPLFPISLHCCLAMAAGTLFSIMGVWELKSEISFIIQLFSEGCRRPFCTGFAGLDSTCGDGSARTTMNRTKIKVKSWTPNLKKIHHTSYRMLDLLY